MTTHKSVSEVGKAFLRYVQYDLIRRGWGGTYDYDVSGVHARGCLAVRVDVDAGGSSPSFKLRVHYFAKSRSKAA